MADFSELAKQVRAEYFIVTALADFEAQPALREYLTKALLNKGITLGQLGRSEEEIAVYEEIARRFANAPEPDLAALAAGCRRALDSHMAVAQQL